MPPPHQFPRRLRQQAWKDRQQDVLVGFGGGGGHSDTNLRTLF